MGNIPKVEVPAEDTLAKAEKAKDSLAAEDELEALNQLKMKYGVILGSDEAVTENQELYEFIDEWMETPYRMGGETKYGIDCSAFAQRLFVKVYGKLIERTAQKQYKSKNTSIFKGKQYLEEGDLVFFIGDGIYKNSIVHVGIYLGNNKFVHATANKEGSGKGEVKISDLTDSFWASRFYCGGRRSKM